MPNQLCKYVHIINASPAVQKLDDIKTLCTYRILSKGVTVCDEDLGNPLVHNGIVVGVLASSGGCNGSPAIYTRVSEYSSWINKTLTTFFKFFNYTINVFELNKFKNKNFIEQINFFVSILLQIATLNSTIENSKDS